MESLSLVRPKTMGTVNEMSGEEDSQERQDRSFRNAWKPFNPDEEERAAPREEQRGEGQQGEADEEEGQGRGLRTPVTPSQEDVEEHSTMHWPFRDWSAHCVRGKTK